MRGPPRIRRAKQLTSRSDQERVREARRGFESELASLRDGCIAQRARLATIPDLPVADQCPGESPPFVKEIAALAAHAQVGHTALEARGKGVEGAKPVEERARTSCHRGRPCGLFRQAGRGSGSCGAGGCGCATDSGSRSAQTKRSQREASAAGCARSRDGRVRERAGLYRALADELRQDRFIDYILRESVRQLAVLASQQLRIISGGRYSLAANKTSFEVVDHANADERRSVATLSGGETFLASLSLAMALARSITDIAGEAIGSRWRRCSSTRASARSTPRRST